MASSRFVLWLRCKEALGNRRNIELVLPCVHASSTMKARSSSLARGRVALGPLALLAALSLSFGAGCSGCGKEAGTSEAGVDATASVTSASTAADARTTPSPSPLCRVKVAPFVVDRNIRLDTGATLTSYVRAMPVSAHDDAKDASDEESDESGRSLDASGDAGTTAASRGVLSETGPRIAIGYAKAHGKPFIAEVSELGQLAKVDVPSTLEALENKPETGTKRVVSRVVPLAPMSHGAAALVDYSEVGADKSRRVHCGPAGGGPFVSTSGPSLILGAADVTSETVDCRSVLTLAGPAALESTLTLEGASLVAELTLAKTRLARRETAVKATEKASDRYAFTMLGFARGEKLIAATARFNGNLVVASAAQALSGPRDEAFWLGAPTNAPSATFVGPDLFVWTTLTGKQEVYGTHAMFDPKANKLAKLEKPVSFALGEDPAGLEERSAVTADGALGLLVVAEKVGGKRTVRIHALPSSTTDGSARVPFTLGEDGESVVEAKLAPTPSGDAMVAIVVLDKASVPTLKAMVLTCREK